jgi:hypothetical protein
MKLLLLPAFLIFACFTAPAQNLIGYNGQEIKKFMKENRKDMNFDKVTNSKFLYLKYSDNYNSQTLLFFLNSDSICKSVRIICDESVKGEKVKEYNSIYKRRAENNWIDTREGRDYIIELKDDEWASVITMKPVK